MPSYKVIAKGFDGRMYDPEGKRNVLHRDEPFPKKNGVEQVPSWLEPMEPVEAEKASTGDNGDPTVKELKAELTELGVEFKGNASKAVLTELLESAKAAAQKAADDSEVAGASFLAEGNQSPAVETL